MSRPEELTLTGWAALGYLLAQIIIVLLVLTIPAYFFMLAMGALHSINSDIPAIGFWTTFICVVALRLLINLFRLRVR
jgi:hypothetical protein